MKFNVIKNPGSDKKRLEPRRNFPRARWLRVTGDSYSISLICKSSVADTQCRGQTVALPEFLVPDDAFELYFLQLSLS